MTIANDLTSINTIKQNIKTAIVAKGVDMTSTTFDQYPSKIAAITTSEAVVVPDWVRPSDWLSLPTIGSTEQKFVGLYAVYNNDSNFVALQAQGAYTVDWGDGVIENFATNVIASHQYTYSNISDTTLCSRGYRQVIITVTPQAGNNLTKVDLQQRHPSVPSTAVIQAPWLDTAIGSPYLLTFAAGAITLSSRLDLLERIVIVSAGSSVTVSCAGLFGLQTVSLPETSQVVPGSTFYNCGSLRLISGLNTTGKTGFDYMFYNCSSLIVAPAIDTSSGTSFSSVFAGCSSLKSVPALNTSKGTTFLQMFSGCKSLTSIPSLDTTNGTVFQGMFSSCSSLTSVPVSNTSEGTNFSSMFNGCSLLTTIPAIDTSKGTNFTNMFQNCTSLTSVPALNTSAGTTFTGMFSGCSSLTSIPALDTSKATSIASMFYNCSTLSSFPISNTSLCNNFSNAFYQCYRVSTMPAISFAADTSNALTSTFNGCSNLSTFNATDIKLSFTVANLKLSAAALNNLYTNLPTVTGKTVTVTGNWGAAASDASIATAKGWTVTR